VVWWILKTIFPGAAAAEGTSPARGAASGARNAVRRESMSFTISPFAPRFQAGYFGGDPNWPIDNRPQVANRCQPAPHQ